MSKHRPSLILHAIALIGLWCFFIGLVVTNRGLFDWLGVDYALYATGARIMFSSHPADVYNLDAVTRRMHEFTPYYGPLSDSLPNSGPLPYLAPTFLLYAPFAWLSPPVGFVMWTAVNLLVALFVVHQLVMRLQPEKASWIVIAIVMTYFPLAYTVFVGQPVVIMLFGLFMAYRALQREQDYQAGLWTGLLFLKAQYPIFFMLLFAYKRRWRALTGMAITGLTMFLISLLAFGAAGITGYIETLRSMSGFRIVHPLVYPHQMINWRGFLINILPAAWPEEWGITLTAVLSVVTVASLAVVWRGAWQPSEPRFAVRMFATVLVMMLASFHNHPHGATLLLVPALDLLARRIGPWSLPSLLGVGLYVPTLVFTTSGAIVTVANLLFMLIVASLTVIIHWELASRTALTAQLVRP